MTDLPLDETIKYLKYLSVNKNEQHFVRFESSDLVVTLVNPDDGREPYIYINDEMAINKIAKKAI